AAATGTATVLKTANAGQSWTLLDGGDIGLADHILGISAIDAQTVWAVGGSDFLVFRSDDGGVTWAKQPATGGLGDANEIYAVDHFTVYAAIDNYIEWTTNGGPSWATHTSYPYTMGVCAVSPDEAWACVYDAIYSTGSIWHTSNGGQTWDDQLVPNGPIRSLWNISFAREPIPEPAVCSLLFCLAIAACTRLRLGRG
ncbi:hypothetical protein GX586_01270, partial [bacterium]|nr:hypothetical protein [bacterium]